MSIEGLVRDRVVRMFTFTAIFGSWSTVAAAAPNANERVIVVHSPGGAVGLPRKLVLQPTAVLDDVPSYRLAMLKLPADNPAPKEPDVYQFFEWRNVAVTNKAGAVVRTLPVRQLLPLAEDSKVKLQEAYVKWMKDIDTAFMDSHRSIPIDLGSSGVAKAPLEPGWYQATFDPASVSDAQKNAFKLDKWKAVVEVKKDDEIVAFDVSNAMKEAPKKPPAITLPPKVLLDEGKVKADELRKHIQKSVAIVSERKHLFQNLIALGLVGGLGYIGTNGRQTSNPFIINIATMGAVGIVTAGALIDLPAFQIESPYNYITGQKKTYGVLDPFWGDVAGQGMQSDLDLYFLYDGLKNP